MTEPTSATPETLDYIDAPEKGFLDGATVTVKSSRFGKLEYAPKAGQEPIPPKIAQKLVVITKNKKEVRIEYSTGLNWSGDGVTVTPDGKSLAFGQGAKRPYKSSDSNYFRESAIRAGVPEDVANRNDASVYEGMTFVIVSEKNKRQNVEKALPKPFPYQRVLSDGTVAAQAASNAPNATAAAPEVAPAVLTQVQAALTAIATNQGKPFPLMSIWSNQLLNSYFDLNNVDAATRNSVTQTLWSNKDNVSTLLAGTPLTVNGAGEISVGG